MKSVFTQLLLVLCLVTGLPYSGGTQAAAVEPYIHLQSSDGQIFVGDSVILELEWTGLSEPPTIASLLHRAQLLRETTGTRIAVINGRVAELKTRRMELLPEHEGVLQFGPLSADSPAGMVRSNSVQLQVDPPVSVNWKPAPEEVQIQMSLSIDQRRSPTIIDNVAQTLLPLTPFVGQHLIAEITLRHRLAIIDETIRLPRFRGFDVLTEHSERRTIDHDAADGPWRTTSWRYHLFATHSGSLTIEPVLWQGTIIRSRTQRAGFERGTAARQLRILPARRSNHWWLPASELELRDNWSKDPRQLAAGDQIIRTITLEARDVLASHLPEVQPPASRALSSTLIESTRTEQIIGNHVQATAEFRFRMIAQSPIPVFLDTVRVHWFDTRDSRAREAIIPARRINVGLPHRADILTQLALDGSRIDRLMLRLTAFTASWLPWHLLAVPLTLLAIWLWLEEFNHWRRQHMRRPCSNPSGSGPWRVRAHWRRKGRYPAPASSSEHDRKSALPEL